MTRLLRHAIAALLLAAIALPANAALKVLATTPEWGALTTELGGDKVNVYTATSAFQDVHRIDAKPSLVARARSADLVVATGADPFVPPIPGLRELDGVWTNREATGMKAVPRRLLILGGGPVGVEMAQIVRRLGGETVLIEGSDHLL